MARAAAGPEIERLIQLLARLPGLGPRSARRAALHLVKKKEQLLDPLAVALAETRDTILTCETCGNIDTQSPCTLCQDATRDAPPALEHEDGWRRRMIRVELEGPPCLPRAATGTELVGPALAEHQPELAVLDLAPICPAQGPAMAPSEEDFAVQLRPPLRVDQLSPEGSPLRGLEMQEGP